VPRQVQFPYMAKGSPHTLQYLPINPRHDRPMPELYICRHTCRCTYTTKKQANHDKHEKAHHCQCSNDCPSHERLMKLLILIVTPESYFMMLKPPAPSNSRKQCWSLSQASLVSSASTGKHLWDGMADNTKEKLKHKREECTKTLSQLKICCVLDPSRVMALGARVG